MLNAGPTSLRWKLLALSVCALLPSLAVFAVTEYQINLSRRAEVVDLARRSAALAASELERTIAGVESLLIAVSHAPVVSRFDAPGCSDYLVRLTARVPHLATLSAVDAAGAVRCSAATPPDDADLVDPAALREALDSRALRLGVYTLQRQSRRPVLPVWLAMPDDDGQPRGVVVAGIDLAWLSGLLLERGLPPDGSVTVAGRDGVIVARQPLPDRFVGTRIPDAYLGLVNARDPGVVEVISQDGTPRVLGYVPTAMAPQALYVSAGLSSETSYGQVVRAARTGAVLAGLVGLATLLVTWFAGALLFVRPITSITAALRRWRSGATDARTGFAPGRDELSALANELDRMMDEIAASEEQRALLAGELVHRVKNTLATVTAIASSTLNKAEPGRDLLPSFLARVAALSRTHEVLTARHWEGAELRAIVQAVVDPLVPDRETRVRVSGGAVHLPADQALGMTMVIHELCINALKHGALAGPDGRVDVSWTIARTQDQTRLSLLWQERDGPAIAPPKGPAGFGSRLIARAFGDAGAVRTSYPESGVLCAIDLVVAPPRGRPPDGADPRPDGLVRDGRSPATSS